MKTKKNKLPAICPSCEASESFVLTEGNVEQEYRGESFSVSTEHYKCSECGFTILATGQVDKLRIKTVDAYRQLHGLLTSNEIVAKRKKMQLTQQQFADHIGVGIASIKRWEGAGVQDKSNDKLIRINTAGINTSGIYFNSTFFSDWMAVINDTAYCSMNNMLVGSSSYKGGGYNVSTKIEVVSSTEPAKDKEVENAFPIAA